MHPRQRFEVRGRQTRGSDECIIGQPRSGGCRPSNPRSGGCITRQRRADPGAVSRQAPIRCPARRGSPNSSALSCMHLLRAPARTSGRTRLPVRTSGRTRLPVRTSGRTRLPAGRAAEVGSRCARAGCSSFRGAGRTRLVLRDATTAADQARQRQKCTRILKMHAGIHRRLGGHGLPRASCVLSRLRLRVGGDELIELVPVGSPRIAPNSARAIAPAAVPRRTASSTDASSWRQWGVSARCARVAARNASPAPVASRTRSGSKEGAVPWKVLVA